MLSKNKKNNMSPICFSFGLSKLLSTNTFQLSNYSSKTISFIFLILRKTFILTGFITLWWDHIIWIRKLFWQKMKRIVFCCNFCGNITVEIPFYLTNEEGHLLRLQYLYVICLRVHTLNISLVTLNISILNFGLIPLSLSIVMKEQHGYIILRISTIDLC